MMIGWWEHSQKGVTDGRTDRRTDGKYHSLSCLVAAKNNRHLFCATSNFVHHFIAISVFKLELQSGNAQFGWKLLIFFLAGVTLKYNKAPLICYLKLCGLFSSHQWIQIGVNSPEMPNLGQNRRFFFMPSDLEICQTTLKNNRTPLLCHVKLCVSSYRHMWIQTGVREPLTLTMDITSVNGNHSWNFMMIRWQKHCQKWVTDRHMGCLVTAKNE